MPCGRSVAAARSRDHCCPMAVDYDECMINVNVRVDWQQNCQVCARCWGVVKFFGLSPHRPPYSPHSHSFNLAVQSTHSNHGCVDALYCAGIISGDGVGCASACNLRPHCRARSPHALFARNHRPFNCTGKVHGSLARAGKVRGQTPKVEKQEKKKTPKGRAKKRLVYTRRFLNVGACCES